MVVFSKKKQEATMTSFMIHMGINMEKKTTFLLIFVTLSLTLLSTSWAINVVHVSCSLQSKMRLIGVFHMKQSIPRFIHLKDGLKKCVFTNVLCRCYLWSFKFVDELLQIPPFHHFGG